MKRGLQALLLVAAAIVTSGPTVRGFSCTPTGFFRDGINMTAALINPTSVTGTVNATGCNIGVYFGAGSAP
jgi:hypothetical protein